MHNIEKSGFHKGQYVGYANGVWRITKTNSTYGNWIARKQDDPNQTVYAMTLQQMSKKLDAVGSGSKQNPALLIKSSKLTPVRIKSGGKIVNGFAKRVGGVVKVYVTPGTAKKNPRLPVAKNPRWTVAAMRKLASGGRTSEPSTLPRIGTAPIYQGPGGVFFVSKKRTPSAFPWQVYEFNTTTGTSRNVDSWATQKTAKSKSKEMAKG